MEFTSQSEWPTVLIDVPLIPSIICKTSCMSTASMPSRLASKSRKCAASNVGQGVTTKKAQKVTQPAISDDSDLVDGDNEKVKQGIQKTPGKAKAKGGKVVAKARGKGGRYVFCESVIY